eukprot:1137379-Pelagomonas_calceolata.AAC.13
MLATCSFQKKGSVSAIQEEANGQLEYQLPHIRPYLMSQGHLNLWARCSCFKLFKSEWIEDQMA